MFESLTGHDVYMANVMARQVDVRHVLIVESEADVGTLQPHIDGEQVRLTLALGSQNVLSAAGLHLDYEHTWVVALVDRDADREPSNLSNVVTTRHYDLDADLFFECPDLARRLISTFGVVAGKDPLSGPHIERIRAQVVYRASVVGVFRTSIECFGDALPMSGFPTGSLFEMTIDGDEFDKCAALVARRLDQADAAWCSSAAEEARTKHKQGGNAHSLCNGHDLIAALAGYLRHVRGRTLKKVDLEAALRGGASCDCMRNVTAIGEVRALFDASGIDAFDCFAA